MYLTIFYGHSKNNIKAGGRLEIKLAVALDSDGSNSAHPPLPAFAPAHILFHLLTL